VPRCGAAAGEDLLKSAESWLRPKEARGETEPLAGVRRMVDIIYVVATAVFFLLAIVYAVACDRLK